MGSNDRPVRNCEHVTVQHKHGTQGAYTQDGCRCTPCTRANTATKREYRTAVAYGRREGLVKAEPVRQHLADLRAAGFSLQSIADASGLALSSIGALVYGVPARELPPTTHVRVDTADRLLAVDPATAALPGGARIPATGSRRRLQALACLGWGTSALTTRTALTQRSLNRLLINSDVDTVTLDTAHAVATLYARLRLAPPPRRTQLQRNAARRSAARAQAAGWRPPHAWHDIDIDIGHEPGPASRTTTPSSPPDTHHNRRRDRDDLSDLDVLDVLDADDAVDEVAVERAMRGEQLNLTPQERLEAVARLTRRGTSARETARLLHTTERHVVRLRSALRTAA